MQAALVDESLIGAIYGPGLHDGDWNVALGRFCSLTNSVDTVLSVFASDGSILRVDSCRHLLSADAQSAYEQHYRRLDPKIAILADRQPGYLFNDIDYFDDDFVSRDPFYQEFSRSVGTRHTLDTLLRKDGQCEIYLATMRISGQGPFDVETAALFRSASHHFLRALQLKEDLDQVRDLAQFANTALDRLSFGILIIDSSGRVVLANKIAKAALEPGEELQLRRGRLCARSGAIGRELERVISGALSAASTSVMLRVPRANDRYWALQIVSLPESTTLASSKAPGAMIVLRGSDAQYALQPPDLTNLHDLTRTEACLALALLRGETLQTYAARRGVKFSTARRQLISIMQKMNIHRQADLTRTLALLGGQVHPAGPDC